MGGYYGDYMGVSGGGLPTQAPQHQAMMVGPDGRQIGSTGNTQNIWGDARFAQGGQQGGSGFFGFGTPTAGGGSRTFGQTSGSFGQFGGQQQGSPYDMNSLMQLQMNSNNQAKQQNQQNVDANRQFLLGLQNQQNPNQQATQGLLGNLLANPEALNDQMKQQMFNQSAASINAGLNSQYTQGAGTLAAEGQADAQSLAGLQERLGVAGLMAQTNAQTDIGMRQAMMRNSDISNAIGLGQSQQRMDQGFGLGIGDALIRNTPQYLPDNYGQLAGMMSMNGQGGMNGQQGGPGQGFYNAGHLGGSLGGPTSSDFYNHNNAKGGSYGQSMGSSGGGFGGPGAGYGNGYYGQPNQGGQQQYPMSPIQDDGSGAWYNGFGY